MAGPADVPGNQHVYHVVLGDPLRVLGDSPTKPMKATRHEGVSVRLDFRNRKKGSPTWRLPLFEICGRHPLYVAWKPT